MSLEESLRSLPLDYLNLLINGQAFSDVTFSVEGRLVHAHRCILAARSLFFRKFFCGPDPPSGLDPTGPRINSRSGVIPVNSVGSEVFLLMLQFLYSGLGCGRTGGVGCGKEVGKNEQGETIMDIQKRFTHIINYMKGLGKIFDEEEVNVKVLKSLNIRWKPTATTIIESKNLAQMTCVELFGKLREYE
ncbi:BTB/POZ domain and ankyrin repeat-containing protein COCH [Cajanus cajan]|uniref:BTB/POZ domain and ankyrin repeat-containing protein COCH n=1 Tax=Cajanus cajan TaxID=3821 RepID=UPI00098D8551|nr:BTB/POZ domain and ankyrin repeat-containing protein COCH [Cajanus cajan]